MIPSKKIRNKLRHAQIRVWSSSAIVSFLFLILFHSPGISWGFSGEYHSLETQDGLRFLRDDILISMISANIHEDDFTKYPPSGPGIHSAIHFDACDFDDSFQNIKDKDDSVIEMTHKGRSPFNAARVFGQLLHTTQDFYSHSNWVELGVKLGEQSIASNQTDFFPYPLPLNTWNSVAGFPNIKIAEGDLPSAWTMTSNFTREGITPLIRDKNTGQMIGHALFTHGRTFITWPPGNSQFGDDCPDELIGWDHPQLNKDDLYQEPNKDDYKGTSSILEYRDLVLKAKKLATDQTNHEFCRLLNLMKIKAGYEGVSIPMALWADKDISFSKSSPCSQKTSGFREVTVKINSIKIKNDTDKSNDPGELNLVFALYSKDLKQSTRSQVGMLEVQSNTSWPDTNRPSPLSLCVNDAGDLVATVQGWDDEGAQSQGIFNDLKFDPNHPLTVLQVEDQVLKGVTVPLPSQIVPHPFDKQANSEDIEVDFHISSHLAQDCSSKGLDQDGDGALDSDDNCPGVPNEGQEDANGDGIGDACDLDHDGVNDSVDNCPTKFNSDQSNYDKDAMGDVCDGDDDNDGVIDTADNCQFASNPPPQRDSDGDGIGDACDDDADYDDDGVINTKDNCPFVPNPDQVNHDRDPYGDECDDSPYGGPDL